MNEMITFAGNDYLGLASHPAVVTALLEAASRYGVGATGSRWSVGWTDVHERLERELADFCQSEDACIFPAAYLGSAIYYGRMAAAGRRVALCDELAHVSQFMGMRAAGLEIRTYRHLDIGDLKQQIGTTSPGTAIIAADGVYGISGEIAPLAELAAIAEPKRAALFVDDAHGFGMLGRDGRGTREHCGLTAGRVTVLGSLSKAIGCSGGFLAAGRQDVEAYRHSAEASGSTNMPAPIAAAALAGLDLVRRQPELRGAAHANAAKLRAIAARRDIRVVCDQHPVVAMALPDERQAADLSRHFLSSGIQVPYFHYASEPRHNLLRVVARAVHTDNDLRRFEQALQTWSNR